MAYYCDKEYWNKRYALNTHPYEWYVGYKELKEMLENTIRQGSRVMLAGCGNSRLGEELYDHSGYTDLTGVDQSEAPISFMIKRKGTREGLHYLRADLTELPMPTNTYDCIIDKATLDSCLCGSEEDTSHRTTLKVLTEISRVLKPNGVFICISHSPEPDRQFLFAPELNWTVTTDTLEKEEGVGTLTEEYGGEDHSRYYVYLCKKKK